MKVISVTIIFLLSSSSSQYVYAQEDQEEVLEVVQQFFQALEENDSSAFRKIFLSDAYYYYVLENQDPVRIGSRSPFNFSSDKDRIITERFRDKAVDIKIHRSIAMVWGAYDLWINNKFSHCGIDAFTLLKTKDGWKISSLSYSIEKERCD